MKQLGKQGFSMMELLVALLIIGILAAVAAPLYVGNTSRAKASEAVAAAGAIREAERTFRAQYGAWQPVGPSEGKSYFGTGGANQPLLGVLIHGNKYFSPAAYQVTTTNPSWAGSVSGVTNTAPQDFVITVTGSSSQSLTADTADGAANWSEVGGYVIQMDNSGRVIFTDGSGYKAY